MRSKSLLRFRRRCGLRSCGLRGRHCVGSAYAKVENDGAVLREMMWSMLAFDLVIRLTL